MRTWNKNWLVIMKQIDLTFFSSIVLKWTIVNFIGLLYMQSNGDSEMEIDRSTTWILARKDKDGNFKSEEVEQIAEKIVSCSFVC